MLYQVTLNAAAASDPNPNENTETLVQHFEADNEAACRTLTEGWLVSTGRVHVGPLVIEEAPKREERKVERREERKPSSD